MSVTPAIPASQIVAVTPSVLSAGGSALDLNGVLLTANTRVPIGQLLSFPSSSAVSAYFGATSQEAALAAIYFLGFDNSNVKPGAMLFWQYVWQNPVAAYLWGGSIAGLGLAQLQALSGSLTVSINGSPVTASSINLAAATSFSNAAAIIQAALNIEGPQAAQVTGAISGTTLTISAVTTGAVAVGDYLSGAGISPGTYITALGTGTGGVGAYTISASQTVSSESMTVFAPAVSYDSISGGLFLYSGTTGATSTIGYATGTLAASLNLTQATGAVLSQGAALSTPAAAMTALAAISQDWASFMTAFEPVTADKEAFASWCNGQNNRFLYAMWDTNIVNTESNGPSPAVSAINAAADSGVAMIYSNPSVDTIGGEIAAFLMGAVASIDFTETGGRATMKFKSQSGLAAQVTDGTSAAYLQGYDINFYGDYTTANDSFVFFSPGAVSGPFKWIDSYVNQIWLNNQFQLALMVLLTTVKSIPYNNPGYALIAAECADPIDEADNFGAFEPGVTLSQGQIAEVNNSAGLNIAPILQQRGWFLQVQDAPPQVRAARGSPPCTFWYVDGGSVQQIALASIEVQ